MRRLTFLFIAAVLSATPLGATPLEGGSPQAQEAVKVLESWGLVKGYPEGHFRGGRSLSRHEAALVLSRALRQLEASQEPFLSQEQLEALKKLQREFEGELRQLGAGVDALEDKLEDLEQRVTEAERLVFSGRWISRYVGQSFRHAGSSGPGGTVNYHDLVGTLNGSNLLPHGPLGILPVVDWSQGRPLTNGTGFSSTLFLNLGFLIDQDWEGDLTLFAHSSQGDSVVDAIWGTDPGYLAHPFTGVLPAGDPQGRSHSPFTTAGFQSLEIRNSSGLTVTLGHYEPELLNPAVFLTPVNPNVQGSPLLGAFGFRVLADLDPFAVEVLGSKLPDGSPNQGGASYDTNALGLSAQYREDAVTVTLNALRVANESTAGQALSVGQVGSFNGRAGEFYANWVNPNGYWVSQLGGVGSPQVAGKGSLGDKRPVPGFANSDDFGAQATLGPQSQTSVGLSAEWAPGAWTLRGDYARTDYRPNKNSAYSTQDSLWRLGAERRLFDEELELALDYRFTGAHYDPFVLSFPTTTTGTPVFRAYHRFPSFHQFWHLYSLHNTLEFPNNREGWWSKASWRYDPDALLTVHYRRLRQERSSLQDVRYPINSLAPGTPNATVLGHSPGFSDPVFHAYSPLSFDAALNPLEDEKGKVESWALEWQHVFTGSPWRLDVSYEQWRFQRASSLPATQGGSQNRVDLKTSLADLSVGRSFGEDFLVTAGYQRAQFSGHYDPSGVFNGFALTNNSTDFKNRDTVQHIPYLTADWQIAPETHLQTEIRHFFTHDRVDAAISSGALGGAQPFSWEGLQVMTTLELSF